MLVLPNRKSPGRPVKAVFLSAGDRDLPGEFLLVAREQRVGDGDPLFAGRKRGPEGRPRALGREHMLTGRLPAATVAATARS